MPPKNKKSEAQVIETKVKKEKETDKQERKAKDKKQKETEKDHNEEEKQPILGKRKRNTQNKASDDKTILENPTKMPTMIMNFNAFPTNM